jgi:hypothetical protein
MVYFENAFHWSFFHHKLKMRGPSCNISSLRGNVTGMFSALSVFGHRIKWTIRLQPEQVWPSAPLHFFTFMMLLAPVTNWEPYGVTLAGYCYALRDGMKPQIVTPFRVCHLQRYGMR